MLYHWARTYSGQLREGDYCTKPDPLIGINLLGFRFFPEDAGSPPHTTFVPRSPDAPGLSLLPDLTNLLIVRQFDTKYTVRRSLLVTCV